MKRFSCFLMLFGLAAISRADSQAVETDEISGSVTEPYTGKPIYKFNLTIPKAECSDAVSLRLMDEVKTLREENDVLKTQIKFAGGE